MHCRIENTSIETVENVEKNARERGEFERFSILVLAFSLF